MQGRHSKGLASSEARVKRRNHQFGKRFHCGMSASIAVIGLIAAGNFGNLTNTLRLSDLAVPQVQAAPTDAAKGQWGRVIPIAAGNHPNLYYNQSEVNELRTMILVRRQPQRLVDLYNNVIRNAVARPVTYDESDPNNLKASMNYMVQPTSAKADAIKASLLSYRAAFPDGLWDWYTTGGCHACGYFVPWMFDLLQAYHPNRLTSSEIRDFEAWFKRTADRQKIASRNQCQVSSPGPCDAETFVAPVVTREGKTMAEFPNWYSRYLGPSLAAALVSGDQAAVDYWADSGWPHDLFTYDGVTLDGIFPSDSANRFDLVMYLQAVYRSGANTDTYNREGFDLGFSYLEHDDLRTRLRWWCVSLRADVRSNDGRRDGLPQWHDRRLQLLLMCRGQSLHS